MTVGIIGLGLIGGSMARAYKNSGFTVLGCDTNDVVLSWAKLNGIADENLTKDNIPDCDLILLAITPKSAAKWLEDNAPSIEKTTLVMDLCGTKRYICSVGFALAEKYGFTFVGGHPMAGSHIGGLKNSRADLFKDETAVLVPPCRDDIALFDRAKKALAPAGFARYTFTTADAHDEMIAYTSQLAHVVSNAFVKSPRAQTHSGISAGSYRDLTRVAQLDVNMWTELFLENHDNLSNELGLIIGSLQEYKDAIDSGNAELLASLLQAGVDAKEKADG